MTEAMRVSGSDVPGEELGDGSWFQILISRARVDGNESTLGVSSFVPGAVSTPLVHEAEELLYIIEGEGELRLDQAAVTFKCGDALFIPPHVWHWIANTGTTAVAMVFVFSHRDYPVTQRRLLEAD